MAAVKVIFLFVLVAGILATKDPNGHCQLKAKGESKKVCNGAIGKDMGKFVKICLNGILKIKKKASVEPAAPQCQNEEGEVFCEGDVVEEKTCNQQSLDTYMKSSDTYAKLCENGTVTNWQPSPDSSLPSPSSYCSTSPNPCPSCESDGQSFCETEVVAEKSCGAHNEENYMKKCENGTLGWKKESVSGSPLKESCDPCPSCELEGNLYCDTEVVQEKSCGEGGYKRVCENGKLSWQTDSPSGSLPAPCEWYGMAFCDQEVIEDLYRWWFLQKCSQGKMNLLGRPWREVVSDPRFKALQDNSIGGV